VKLLVLGGTKFVGRALTEAAVDRGHEVTLFNRGQTNPGLFPEAEHLHGDRETDLSALEGREWDAVFDVSGYLPQVVRASADLLAGSVGRYVFISSVAVYADLSTGTSESSPVRTWDGRSENAREDYGELKAACEQVVRGVFSDDRALVVRSGVVAGPRDPLYRFTYWVERVATGGDVLAPEPRGAPVQVLDARDLGDWLARCAEEQTTGVYNATGPAEALGFDAFLEACRDATGSAARFVWIDSESLAERFAWMKGTKEPDSEGLAGQRTTVPFCTDLEHRGLYAVNISRALAAGLRHRPLEETIRDTLAWARSGALTFDPPVADASGKRWTRPGLSPEREAALLRELAWTRP
jgi:2'-hydroxyisoflavone reductase